jgi:hypothetical protein
MNMTTGEQLSVTILDLFQFDNNVQLVRNGKNLHIVAARGKIQFTPPGDVVYEKESNG